MKTDELGIPRFTNRDLINMIYSGHAEKCHVVLCDPCDDIDKFNAAMEEQGLPKLTKYIPINVDKSEFDNICQSEWLMPEEYKKSEKVLWHDLVGMAKNMNEADRIMQEFEAFKERNMLDLLCYLMYLVDFMRENDILWGVGRGSSVASFILYKIGVHKINSLEYDLDWHEFLRD